VSNEDGRILVVDDNEMNRDMLSRRLHRRGYHVTTAKDGEEALAILAEKAFDLVLLDIMMPGIDGLGVLELIRAKHSLIPLPVIMVTAKDEGDFVVRALDLGANDYVTKPLDFPVVLARVRTQLRMKRLEQEVQGARDAAVRASQAKSNFLAGISHEIRTPVNAIVGMTDLLSETHLDTKQTEYLRVLNGAAESLLALLDDILDLSRIEAGKVDLEQAPFDLREVMDSAIRVVQVRAREKELPLESEIAPDVALRRVGDARRLAQVLVNLLGNAVKFTHRGSVRLRVERDPTADPDSGVRFTVCDTGIGIAPDRQEAIFETFEQADPAVARVYGGTGLGLSICRQLVERMGGRISVASEPGKGSTFWFSLPLPVASEAAPPDAPPQPPPAAAPPPSAPPRPLRVLLADDVESSRAVIRGFLEASAHALDEAPNGRKAVEMFQAGAYDVVLMDLEMPVMDGLEAARAMRRVEEETGRDPVPIVALTASSHRDELEAARQAGCTAHLPKPVRKHALMQALAAVIGASPSPEAGGPNVVCVDALIEELVPDFLRETAEQVERVKRLLEAGDYEAVRQEAHKLRGVGGSYGFDRITEYGDRLHRAAVKEDARSAARTLAELERYLEEVHVVYRPSAASGRETSGGA